MSLKEHYVKLYKEVSAVPSVTSAAILPGKDNTLCIHSNWSAQDLVKLEKVCFSRDYTFDSEKSNVLLAGIPYDTTSICKQAYSKSGKKQAIIREKKSSKNSNDCYDLEIWNEFLKEKTIELTDHENHGKVNTNTFSCLAWSSDEKYLLYTAEAKQLKSSSYFKVLKTNEEEKDSEKKSQTQGKEYILREEWGENFVGSHHSILVILDIETEKTEIVSVDNQYNELSIGEAIWGPDDKTIVFVGYNEFPQRLGIRSCPIRKSAIYSYDCQTSNIDCISGGGSNSVRLPRFSPDFKTLIYLENKMGGPHFKASKLQKCDWKTKKITTLVEIVDCPQDDEFPGLYVNSIPEHCWFKNYIFLTSQWRSFVVILAIDCDNGTVQKIESNMPLHPDAPGDIFGTSIALNVYKNIIIAEFSSLNIEPCLVIGHLQIETKLSVTWKYLDTNAPVKHNDIDWKVIKMNEHKAEFYFEVILVTPSAIKSTSSAIIRPHGGPHVAYSPGFSKNIAAFTKLKYINCLVNYRGSAGFGENNLNSLPGKVGKQDVADVQQVAEWLKKHPDISVGDFFCVGGSHGGFLSAHLVGQYPDFYKAAVLLNPVVDIAGMSETTDIPDWNWVEGGCGDIYDSSSIITAEHYKSMWERSPIKYAENVRSPVLLLLGNKDLRVPYAQGLKYFRLLKARKVDVSAYVYEDCHSLAKTPHDADVFMQTALWLEKHSS